MDTRLESHTSIDMKINLEKTPWIKPELKELAIAFTALKDPGPRDCNFPHGPGKS